MAGGSVEAGAGGVNTAAGAGGGHASGVAARAGLLEGAMAGEPRREEQEERSSSTEGWMRR